MQIAADALYDEFQKSNVFPCFIPNGKEGEYYVKMHADDPDQASYMVGSIGDTHGTPESFRLILPTPLAVGDRGTVIHLSRAAIKSPYPRFVPKFFDADGYNVMAHNFGASTYRIARLMALTWLNCPEGATEVDHIDGNPAHDELSNLEWVSHAENLRRGRHSKPCRWDSDDYVLMIHEGYDPRLVHPSEVAAITGSRNGCHVLRRGTRRSANGWYMRLNPSCAEAIAFVESLPLEDKSYYLEAVANLF